MARCAKRVQAHRYYIYTSVALEYIYEKTHLVLILQTVVFVWLGMSGLYCLLTRDWSQPQDLLYMKAMHVLGIYEDRQLVYDKGTALI